MLEAGGKGTDARNWNCNEDIQVIFTDKLANESGIGNNLLYRYGDIVREADENLKKKAQVTIQLRSEAMQLNEALGLWWNKAATGLLDNDI
ncbi:hypothetical protein WN943_009332 [Citrus x changshan-huyou]